IVISILGLPGLVACQEHRHPLRQEESGQEVPRLPSAQIPYGRIVRSAFGAAVPAQVVVFAVLVVLAVGFVVLSIVAYQVTKGEAVVAGDKIDAGIGSAAAALVEVAAAAQPVGELGGGSAAVPLPETAHGVAVFAVPLRPEHREIAHLVAPQAQVPWL